MDCEFVRDRGLGCVRFTARSMMNDDHRLLRRRAGVLIEVCSAVELTSFAATETGEKQAKVLESSGLNMIGGRKMWRQ